MKSYEFLDCDELVLPCFITRRGLRVTYFFAPPYSNSRDAAQNMKFDRGKYGDSGDGGGGKNSGSGKGNSSSGDGLEISDVGGPPEGNNEATTNGGGGAISIEVDSGHSNEESSDDGGTRNQVDGTE